MNTLNARKVWQTLNGTTILVVFLAIYDALALAMVGGESVWVIVSFGVIMISGGLFWLLAQKITGKKKDWKNLFITLSIIFLIWHYGVGGQDWPWVLVVVLGAIMAKFFFYYRGVSLINPSVFGLLLGSLAVMVGESFFPASGAFVSWWGVNVAGSIMLVMMFFWLIVGGIKFRKYYLWASFLVAYFALLLLSGKMDLLQFTMLDATVYFWAGIMLMEPKTSPSVPKQQVFMGILAAILLFVLNSWEISFAELWTLVLTNMMNVYFRLGLTKRATTKA